MPADNTYRNVKVSMGGRNGLPGSGVCFSQSGLGLGYPGFQINPRQDRTRDDGWANAGYTTRIRAAAPTRSRLWVYDNDCGSGPDKCETRIAVFFSDPADPPPVVTITQPPPAPRPTDPNKATYSTGSDILIDVDIQDNGTIDVARVRRQNTWLGGAQSGPPGRYAWYYVNAARGNNRYVYAQVIDNAFNFVRTRRTYFDVVDNQPPTVVINSPSPGQNVIVGVEVPITATVTDPEGDTITQVQFQVDGSSFPPISTDITGPPWSAIWTPTIIGSHTIRARATDDGGSTGPWTTITVGAIAPNPWWQVVGGSVSSNQNVSSSIPSTCIAPGCLNSFIISDQDGPVIGYPFPGTVLNGAGTADFDVAPLTTGIVSATGWLTNARSEGTAKYTYAYFDNLASGKYTPNSLGSGPGSTMSQGDISPVAAPPASDGYSWLHAGGDLTINSNLNINANRKIVTFVEGNLLINERIRMVGPSTNKGFVMFVVGGDITIDASVDGDPGIEGVYFADGRIVTETGGAGDDEQLICRGSFVAQGGFNLQRDLGPGNQNTPAEVFEYAPEILLNYPTALSDKHLIWQEVAP